MADSHQRSPIARMNPFGRRISRRAVKIAAPFALVATLAPVGLGVVAAGGVPATADIGASFAATDAGTATATRAPQVSRSVPRVAWTPAEIERQATARAVKNAHVRLWTTDDLTLWSLPGDRAKKLGTVEAGTHVLITGRERYGRVEILRQRKPRWVKAGNLSESEPIIAGAGLSTGPCAATGGSTLGLTSAAQYVLSSVCANFPQISTYGGRDPHGEHVSGEAIDIMTSDVALGTAIAEFLIAHASEFGIEDVIWRQQIWMPGHGWKGMSDRGSATANHYDHVHVKVY
ncbi:mucin-2 protein [Nocardioides sp.]|uniref:mucin-2 protein n=1 Tax=Nocardioides sp. TaxID=35761 RepID=UPI002B5B67A8|nr:mucin-2 protein [Nocardioides sp.]HSX67056.1 mucin-2 protein [Nocardioides sp.]